MAGQEPGIEVPIYGTMVGFLRRDVRNVDSRERKLLERLVADQQREAGPGRTVTRIIVDTDYPDADRLAYSVCYRVIVTGSSEDEEEPSGVGQPG